MRRWPRTFLARLGFEPAQTVAGPLVLRNCPFQPLAARSTELVCGINHAFLTGFLEGLGTSSAVAVLDPQPGPCCVELRPASAGH
jgi:predicted ArsR family transcriptional regulator